MADPGGTGMITPPPPPWSNLSRYWKPMQSVRDRERSPPPPWNVDDVIYGQCPRVCVLVNVFTPPPPLSGNPVSAPALYMPRPRPRPWVLNQTSSRPHLGMLNLLYFATHARPNIVKGLGYKERNSRSKLSTIDIYGYWHRSLRQTS